MDIFFQKRGIVAVLSIMLVFFALPARAEELTPPAPCPEKEQFISTGMSQFIKPPCAKILPAPDYLTTEILSPKLPEAFIYQYKKPRITKGG